MSKQHAISICRVVKNTYHPPPIIAFQFKNKKILDTKRKQTNFSKILRRVISRKSYNINKQILMSCWPCISIYLSQYLTNLTHKICFTVSFISCLYMFWAHVLITRRSKLHYTASGIITDTRGCVIQFWPPDDEHMCSKHVEAWNKTYCKTNFVH